MLTNINSKLPVRNIKATKEFYTDKLGFTKVVDYKDYLILARDRVEIHFFEFKELDPNSNYGQVYIRTNDIAGLYQALLKKTSAFIRTPL